MSRISAIRDAWHPQTRHDREAVLFELHEILASPHFCNSKRYPALLQYIVEKTLAGDSESLKERTLGVEVFDRPPSYDTNADTVVRYTAGEVRKRLSLYYHELDRKPAIQIALPPGSYVPEFLSCREEADSAPDLHALHPVPGLALPVQESGADTHWPGTLEDGVSSAWLAPDTELAHRHTRLSRVLWWTAGVFLMLAFGAAFSWRDHSAHTRSPLDSFWSPVTNGQSAITVCLGGSVFSQTHASGVATATKDVDYPFISMQSAAAVAQISALLARTGNVSTQLQSAATTPLTDLREHPVILLGGYNNQWTLRLIQPLRFHFSTSSIDESIEDGANTGRHWERDPSLPYSNADDYGLIARFRDTTTDSWVVVLAGVGRNGTEAASEFATSPHYMQLLRDQAGTDFTNKNVEVVLKVSVIDGKTGAPAIMAVQIW